MSKTLSKEIRLLLLAIMGVIVAVASIGKIGYARGISGESVSLQEMHAQFVADFSDSKVLVGASHNVFVGRVIKQIGNKERGLGPETQFEVEVIENIKGSLNGAVIVNQQGGYKDGVLYVMDGGDVSLPHDRDMQDYLLQPGSTYIFATRYNEAENWHTMNPYANASKLLSSNESANGGSLKAIADNDSRVQELKSAYPSEILLEADVRAGKIYNDYRTRKPLPNQKTDEVSQEEEGEGVQKAQ